MELYTGSLAELPDLPVPSEVHALNEIKSAQASIKQSVETHSSRGVCSSNLEAASRAFSRSQIESIQERMAVTEA